MKRPIMVSLSSLLLAFAASSFAQVGVDKGAKPMDKGMCEQMMQGHMDKKDKGHMGMMGKGHMGMMGKDMPKECMEMMQGDHMGMAGKSGDMAMGNRSSGDRAAQGKSHQGVGIVKDVDTGAGKVTLQHEAIPSLSWPAMTMGFSVQDRTALENVKPGQKVEFDFVQDGSNNVITQLK